MPAGIGHTLKNKQNSMYMYSRDYTSNHDEKMKFKNRSHRYDINKPRSRHGHKSSKYKECLSMMMLLCIKNHLSNI